MHDEYERALAELHDFTGRNPSFTDCDILWTNLSGVQRGKRLRWHELEAMYRSGRPFPGSVFVSDVTGKDCEVAGLVWADGDADRLAFPVPGTLRPMPWAIGSAQVLLEMRERDGGPAQLDPRQVLRRVIDRFEPMGLVPVVACELEFYLVDAEAAAEGRAEPPSALRSARRDPQNQPYGMRDLDDLRPFVDELYAVAQAQDLPAGAVISEYGPGQVEFTLTHRADACRAVDEVIAFKRAVRAVALRHGMEATFMAKPYAARPGSGMHIHLSIVDSDGANIFADQSPEGSPALQHAIGGMAALMPESFALFAPNANSYRRFRANSYAPLTPSWGVDNRTVSLRVTAGAPETRHIEHRVCGADANPYLAVAAVLAATHHGLEGQIDPGSPIIGDGYAAAAGTARLARNWYEAVDCFENGAVLPGYLGRHFVEAFAAVKRIEQDRFYGENTVRDYDWYLRSA